MIHVRDALTADVATLVEFNCRLAQETEGKQLDRQVVTRGVQRVLAAPALGRYFVADVEGSIVGQTMITYELTDWRDGILWWLQSVYVDAAWRGRGVFRQLLDHLRQQARATPDVRGLRLYVETHNEPALNTYRRLGFEPSGHVVYEQDWSLKSRTPSTTL